jgi:peptidoglycan/xylan/chitin deacetylase (PgdA/CDA1 family)
LVAAKNATTGLPVDFLTVSVDGRWSEVAQNNGGLPLWLDKGGEWSRGKGVDRVPTTVVLDPAGEVRYVSGGVVRTDELVQAVRAAKGHKPEAGVLYLTFDDFPPANGGEELLDELRALGVKATLFCLGSRVEASASLLKRALAEGHSLQIHSWDHHATDPQLEQCRTTFKRVLGVEPTLYRAPGSEVIVGDERHHRIVDPFDYSRPSRKELLRRILPAVCSEAVIQLHAGVSVTREALSELVEDLRKRGFRFGTLSQNGL